MAPTAAVGCRCGESEQRLGKCHNFGRLLIIPRGRERSVIFTHEGSHAKSQDRNFLSAHELECFLVLTKKLKRLRCAVGSMQEGSWDLDPA